MFKMHNLLFLSRTWSFLKFIEKYVLVFPLMWHESHSDTAFLAIRLAPLRMLWSVLLTTYLASLVNIAQGTLRKTESTEPFSHMHNEHEQKTDKSHAKINWEKNKLRAVRTPLIALFLDPKSVKKPDQTESKFMFCGRNWYMWQLSIT